MNMDTVNLNTSLSNVKDNVNNEVSKIKSSDKDNNNFSSVMKKAQVDKDSKKLEKPDYTDNQHEQKEKIETYLKKAGFTDEEIKSIEDKIDKGQIDKDSILSLLSLLFSSDADIQLQSNDLQNGKSILSDVDIIKDIGNVTENSTDGKLDLLQNILDSMNKSEQLIADKLSGGSTFQDVKNVVDSVVDENMGFLKEVLSNLGNSDKSKQLAEKLSEKIADSIILKLNQGVSSSKISIDTSDIKSRIYEELLSKLSSNSQDIPQAQDDLKNVKLYQSLDVKNVPTENLNMQNSKDSGTGDNLEKNNDSETLNKILGESKGEGKISRVVNFMTQFNNIRGDNSAAEAGTQALTINKNAFSSDIIKSIKYMELNNIKELTVKVTPKELGSITINLVMEEGRMKAVLTASNKDAYNILNSNLQDMSNKLQNNEIKVQNFSLNLYHEDTTFFKDQGNRDQQGNERKKGHLNSIGNISEEEEPENDYYSENNVNILA
ncbi:flagellar hook-length control protein FliK [Clostridium sp. LBM24168]